MKTRTFIKIFSLLFASKAFSEYRVYQYQVTNKMRKNLKDNSRLVTSTLDPVSYLSYHGGFLSTGISLLRSWHCVGYTGQKKDFCTPPLEKLEEENGL